jgi:hypothetical protein
MSLNQEDLRIAHQALNEVCNGARAIEDWEFSMLMGCERKEAQLVMDKIEEELKGR